MPSAAHFTFNQREGVLLLAHTSAVSASAIIALLSYITYSALTILPGSRRRWRIGGATEILFLNQLGADLVQATGGLMNIKWAVDGTVYASPFCVAQGAVKQAADVGVALSTLAIAFYTLYVLCFSGEAQVADDYERRKSLRRGLIFVVCLWIVIGLLVAVDIGAHGAYHFYGPTGYWCWIAARYSVHRIVLDYAAMWMTAGINIVIYSIVFLYIKGYIATKGWRIYRPPVRQEISDMASRRAYGLLYYPAVYIIAVLPLSIVRYSAFTHHSTPFGATIFVDMIYLSNGLFNVILFSVTRPFLLPHDPNSPDGSPRQGPISEVQPPIQDAAINGPPSIPQLILNNSHRQSIISAGPSTLQSSTAGWGVQRSEGSSHDAANNGLPSILNFRSSSYR
ncbi:hypothetical protein F5148DRAFT_1309566 [Russula earlei]|uniref:Uncharacterized protein n=1 Tax=Russula earlei TaxID=71964 RepID=A0ACC0U6R0_9AGAM|nr:hypothetical protein F5148DRAFT_1309566 [Russula earlei]